MASWKRKSSFIPTSEYSESGLSQYLCATSALGLWLWKYTRSLEAPVLPVRRELLREWSPGSAKQLLNSRLPQRGWNVLFLSYRIPFPVLLGIRGLPVLRTDLGMLPYEKIFSLGSKVGLQLCPCPLHWASPSPKRINRACWGPRFFSAHRDLLLPSSLSSRWYRSY